MHFVKEYNFQFYTEHPKTSRKKLRWIVAAITIIAAVTIGLTSFFLIKRYQTKESNETSNGHNLKLNINETNNNNNTEFNNDLEEKRHVDDSENEKNEIEKTPSESGENEEEKQIKEEERQKFLEEQRQREEAEKLQEEQRQRIIEEEKQRLLAEEEKQRLLEEERILEVERLLEEEKLQEEQKQREKEENEKIQRLLEEKRQRLLEEARLAEKEKQRNINECNDLIEQMEIINESHKNLMLNKVFAVKEGFELGNQNFKSKYGNSFETMGEAIDINITIIEEEAEKNKKKILAIEQNLKIQRLLPVEVPDYETSKRVRSEEGTKALIDSFKKQKPTGNIFQRLFNNITKNAFIDRLTQMIMGETLKNNFKQLDIGYTEQLTLESVEKLKKFNENAKAVINYFTHDFKDLIKPTYVDISHKFFDDLFEFKDDGTIKKAKPELNNTEVITDIHKMKTTQLYKCLKINFLTAFLKKYEVGGSWIGDTVRYNAYVNNNGWIKLSGELLNDSVVFENTKQVYEKIKKLITDVYKDVSKESLEEKEKTINS